MTAVLRRQEMERAGATPRRPSVSAPILPSALAKPRAETSAQEEPTGGLWEMSFLKCIGARGALTVDEYLAERVVAALWHAFPESTSENDLAARASPYFRDKVGKPVDPRTIKYWLRKEKLPSHLHTLTLQHMVGGDFFAIPRQGAMPGRASAA
jgi:hypothetical protein